MTTDSRNGKLLASVATWNVAAAVAVAVAATLLVGIALGVAGLVLVAAAVALRSFAVAAARDVAAVAVRFESTRLDADRASEQLAEQSAVCSQTHCLIEDVTKIAQPLGDSASQMLTDLDGVDATLDSFATELTPARGANAPRIAVPTQPEPTWDGALSSAEQAVTVAQEARSLAANGEAGADQASDAMQSVRRATGEAGEVIRELGSKSQQVGGIV